MGDMWALVGDMQGQRKHFSFGQANYSGGVIRQCWTRKWAGNGGMDYGIK